MCIEMVELLLFVKDVSEFLNWNHRLIAELQARKNQNFKELASLGQTVVLNKNNNNGAAAAAAASSSGEASLENSVSCASSSGAD